MRSLYKRVILEPGDHDFDSTGAFNPACTRDGDGIHVLYRASDTNYRGTLGYAWLDLGHNTLERSTQPVLAPSAHYDKFGVEDPKLIRWGRGVLLLYHAIGTDGEWIGVSTAGAYTSDFRRIRKMGLIRPFVPLSEALPNARGLNSPTLHRINAEYATQQNVQTLWGKDLVLFPEKFGNEYLAIYRMPPAICITSLASLNRNDVFWRSGCLDPKRLLLSPAHWFESRSISPSAPPILTNYGWLLVFHCVDIGADGNARYTASAALLDREDPRRVLGRLTDPLLEPEHEWERHGTTGNCVYVSSVDVHNNSLYVYYGAADVRSAVAVFTLSDVVAAMR